MVKKRFNIEALGARLFGASGEGEAVAADFGESKNTKDRSSFIKGLFDVAQLTSLLPYATYDDETGLFYNTDSVGFVIETEPLTGASQEIQTQIQNFFNTVMPTESALQVILYADPCIGAFTDYYKKTREHEAGKTTFPILQKMVKNRTEFFDTLCYGSDYSPYTVRNFRNLWAFTISSEGARSAEILSVREQLFSTLSMIGLNPFVWKPVDLLQTVDSILHCARGQTKVRDFVWNAYQNLSDQLATVSHRTDIDEDAITTDSFTKTANDQSDSDAHTRMKIRTFSVSGQPDEWSLSLMNDLIGHEQNDRQQIGCPFLLHYGISIPKQDGLKAKIFSKESIVSKQANSALSKILPHLKRESAELSYVLNRLNTGDRIVHTNMSLIILSPEDMVDTVSNAVKNIFITHQWRLEENKRFHLPTLLMALPMSWSPPMVDALSFHKMLKTTLTTEVANN
ncbi:MAG: conjugal transfer protein TraC, partial [Alphaproteobacteria bacterium]|nr:conjugal transfer protein TraC [Alphaproteobacteria bacterium]